MRHVRLAMAIAALGIATLTSSTAAQSPVTAAVAADDIVGAWHRAQGCEDMVAAFDAAGLLETHLGWAQGDFFPEGAGPGLDDPCAGSPGPVEHGHTFSADGQFGSIDEAGVATFDVLMPEDCIDACADAHAWAISAFESGPWQRVVEPTVSASPTEVAG